jgi:hypothetical protein
VGQEHATLKEVSVHLVIFTCSTEISSSPMTVTELVQNLILQHRSLSVLLLLTMIGGGKKVNGLSEVRTHRPQNVYVQRYHLAKQALMIELIYFI